MTYYSHAARAVHDALCAIMDDATGFEVALRSASQILGSFWDAAVIDADERVLVMLKPGPRAWVDMDIATGVLVRRLAEHGFAAYVEYGMLIVIPKES